MKKHTDPIESLGVKDGKEVETIQQNNSVSSNITIIEGSPFAIFENKINDNTSEYIIVMGKHIACNEKFESKEAANYWVQKTDWNTILNVVAIYFNALVEQQRIEKRAKLNNITKSK